MTDDARNKRNLAFLFFGGILLSLLLMFSHLLLGLEEARFGMIFLGATILFLTVVATLGQWSHLYHDRPNATQTHQPAAELTSRQDRAAAMPPASIEPGDTAKAPSRQPPPNEGDRPSPR